VSVLLEVDNLDASYGDFQALFGVSLTISQSEVIAIVGANGAGKSTLLRCLTGLLPTRSTAIRLSGVAIGGWPAHRIARAGVAMSPEGRRLFPSLSVTENLLAGAAAGRKGFWTLEKVRELFPILRDKAHQPATELSGGQQQMVALGRALMANPSLLLLDEVSLGLAPVAVRDVYARLPAIRANETSVVVVEQDIGRATEISDRLYCLQEGRVTLTGPSADLTRDDIAAAYFGRERAPT
jgi:branched-chain amino acid transport system ATP-binding protein